MEILDSFMDYKLSLHIFLPPLALGLDVFLGDPKSCFHPVCIIGRGADILERISRHFFSGNRALLLCGGFCVAALVLISVFLVLWLCSLPFVGWFAALYFSYAGLALGSLLRESYAVYMLLRQKDLTGARLALGMLVSRETSHMSHEEVCTALAETMSENLCDGFVAPFFYLIFFGPAGLWGYKTVSTLDSMWGYRTEKWRYFGYIAARLDDILAYIPARLTAFFLLLAHGRAFVLTAWPKVQSDARKMDSPNAGWPMAAAAWALQRFMGGRAVYFGKVTDKPVLGPKGKSWNTDILVDLFILVRRGAMCSTLFLWLVSVIHGVAVFSF